MNVVPVGVETARVRELGEDGVTLFFERSEDEKVHGSVEGRIRRHGRSRCGRSRSAQEGSELGELGAPRRPGLLREDDVDQIAELLALVRVLDDARPGVDGAPVERMRVMVSPAEDATRREDASSA
jgi:hypothetical protein